MPLREIITAVTIQIGLGNSIRERLEYSRFKKVALRLLI